MNELRIIIGIISTFLTVLFAIFIFSVKAENKLSNRIFGAFLIINAVETSGFFIHDFIPTSARFSMFKDTSFYLFSPLLYLYICSVCYSDFRLKKKHLWHLLPFVIGNLIMTPRFYLGDSELLANLIPNITGTWEVITMHIFIHTQLVFYFTISFFVLKRAKSIFFENHSNNTIQAYKWLHQILLFWIAIISIALIKNILKYTNLEDPIFPFFQMILIVAILMVSCWYILKALNNPDLFKGVDSKTKLTKDLLEETHHKSENGAIINDLKLFMDKEEPYLNPSLSIRNLAQQMNIPVRELSIAINHDLNQHFFDFVNEYRIKRAMHLLRDTNQPKLTVLEILYDVGFNSKSSFNTAFKKYTNVTPTQYRKQVVNS